MILNRLHERKNWLKCNWLCLTQRYQNTKFRDRQIIFHLYYLSMQGSDDAFKKNVSILSAGGLENHNLFTMHTPFDKNNLGQDTDLK